MMPEAARESTTLRAMPSHSCSFFSTSCTGVFIRVMEATTSVQKSEEGKRIQNYVYETKPSAIRQVG